MAGSVSIAAWFMSWSVSGEDQPGFVDEDDARTDLTRMVETVDADDGIGERLDPIRRQLEIIVGVNPLQPVRNVLVAQRRFDADCGQCLLGIFAEPLPFPRRKA